MQPSCSSFTCALRCAVLCCAVLRLLCCAALCWFIAVHAALAVLHRCPSSCHPALALPHPFGSKASHLIRILCVYLIHPVTPTCPLILVTQAHCLHKKHRVINHAVTH